MKAKFGLAVFGLLSICLLSCGDSYVVKQEEIVDSDSLLLGILMSESDFSGEWRWVASWVAQEPEVPTAENDFQVERATQDIAGFYGSDEYYIRIFHHLYRYEPEAPRLDASVSHSYDNAAGMVPFLPTITPLGEFTEVDCLRTIEDDESRFMTCRVTVAYSRIVSVIVIRTSGIGEKTLEEILNRAASRIDTRIQQFEGE